MSLAFGARYPDPEGVVRGSRGNDPGDDLIDSRFGGEVAAEPPIDPGCGDTLTAVTVIRADKVASR